MSERATQTLSTESSTAGSSRVESTDVSRLLFFNTAGVRWIAGFFVLTTAVFTFATLDTVKVPYPSLIAMVVVCLAGVLLIRRHPDPYPLRWALLVVAAVAVSTALVLWQLPVEGSPGRASWHFGANTWLLFFLTLRRRAGLAWLGFGVMTGITMLWVSDTGRSVGEGIGFLQTHAGILLVATLFASNLRRTSARINALNERSVEAAAAYAAADAATEIRRQRVAELATAVVPLLERIARGDTLSEADKLDFKSTEATLRDSVRGRHLMVPAVVDAVRQARLRGVEVNVLDDRGRPLVSGEAMARVTSNLVEILDGVHHGSVTMRLSPAGRDVAVSVVVRDEGDGSRHDWDERGEPVAV